MDESENNLLTCEACNNSIKEDDDFVLIAVLFLLMEYFAKTTMIYLLMVFV